MDIKILGTGCTKCNNLEKAVKAFVEENKIQAEVTKVQDIVEIMKFGVVSTPALVIDSKVVLTGRVPSNNDLKKIFNIQ